MKIQATTSYLHAHTHTDTHVLLSWFCRFRNRQVLQAYNVQRIWGKDVGGFNGKLGVLIEVHQSSDVIRDAPFWMGIFATTFLLECLPFFTFHAGK